MPKLVGRRTLFLHEIRSMDSAGGPMAAAPEPLPLLRRGRRLRLLKVPQFTADSWAAAPWGSVVGALAADGAGAHGPGPSPGSTSASSPDGAAAAAAAAAPGARKPRAAAATYNTLVLTGEILNGGGGGGRRAAAGPGDRLAPMSIIRSLRVREGTGDQLHIFSYRCAPYGGGNSVDDLLAAAPAAAADGPQPVVPVAVEGPVEAILTAVPGALSADYRSLLRSRTEAVKESARPVRVAPAEETAADANAPRLFRYFHQPSG